MARTNVIVDRLIKRSPDSTVPPVPADSVAGLGPTAIPPRFSVGRTTTHTIPPITVESSAADAQSPSYAVFISVSAITYPCSES